MTDFLVQMCATLLKTKHFQLLVAKVINNNVEAWKMTELNLWKKSTVTISGLLYLFGADLRGNSITPKPIFERPRRDDSFKT